MTNDEFHEEEIVKDDNSIYSDEARENMVENDEIEPFEEGFMAGAEMDGQNAKCRKCGKILLGAEDIVEREIDDKKMRFCCVECADKYEEMHS